MQTTQQGHQTLKVEEHIWICGRGSFRIFPFLHKWLNVTNLRRTYETKFQREYKTKLNQLWQIRGMTQRFNVLLITFKNTPIRDHNFLVQYIMTPRECPCLTSISIFSTLQTSLKLVIKYDVKFYRFLSIKDSAIVNFHIKSCSSLKR